MNESVVVKRRAKNCWNVWLLTRIKERRPPAKAARKRIKKPKCVDLVHNTNTVPDMKKSQGSIQRIMSSLTLFVIHISSLFKQAIYVLDSEVEATHDST